MIINAANISAAYVSHKALFNIGRKAAKPQYMDLSQRTESSGKSNVYHFTGGIPGLREWVDKRVINSLSRFFIDLVNTTYELTIGIPREDFEDDNLGVYNGDVQMLGMRAEQHPDKLFFDLLNNGFADACYDERPFFDDSHPRMDGEVQDNLGTGALDATEFEAALTALHNITDEHGEPLDLINESTDLRLIVPTALKATAKEIVEAKRLANGADNPNYGAAKVMVSPRLTSTTAWFVGIAGLPIKPVIYQVRRKPEFAQKTKPNEDNVFFDKEFIYGVDGRWAMGYGYWQLMYGSTGAA